MPLRSYLKEELHTFFDRVMDTFCAENVPRESTQRLAGSRDPLNPGVPTKGRAAKDFYIEQAVFAFGLVPSGIDESNVGESLKWRIEDIPETKDFVISQCLCTLLQNYAKNFEHRTALDFILNECLMVLKGNNLRSEDHATGSQAQHTPTQWDNVKICGEVSLSHMITRPVNGKSVGDFLGTIVNGTVDRGIGRIVFHSCNDTTSKPKRHLQSLLLVVQAKTALNLTRALPQLVVYLASIHQSRLRRKRRNATVYGVLSDASGYSYIFVTITHDGVLKQSRRFEVGQGEIQTVLGCLKYILEMSSPTKKDGGELVEEYSDGDPDMDIDDNSYHVRPPE